MFTCLILMKKVRQWQRILILSLLLSTVLAPLFFVSNRLKHLNSIGRKEFIEDLSAIKYRADVVRLKAIEQEADQSLKEPKPIVFEEKDLGHVVSYGYSHGNTDTNHSENDGHRNNLLGTNHERQQIQQETISSTSEDEGKSNKTTGSHEQNVSSPVRRTTDKNIMEMKDQLIQAKVYLSFMSPGSNSHLAKELRQRIKDSEKVMGEATKDTELPRSALQKMKFMGVSLAKASHVYPDCSLMAKKLRAMTSNAEEQLRAQKNQAAFLVQLAARTTPKGLHCLSMRLTAEYFALPPEGRQLPNQKRVHDPELYHYAVFSDNILACGVVVNSAVSSAKDAEKIVFHVVTDSLNLPAISMWFLLNPPGKATIHIQSVDSFDWLLAKYNSTLKKQNSYDQRYTSVLNHLRFYLPDVFPFLKKIVLFDHDVVVQKDLTGLWRLNMIGKVIGVVETCQENQASFRRMDMFINFSDPFVGKRFDVKACTWAFGMNLFDLQEWRRKNLTALYHKYLQMGHKRPIWKAGSLPLGWATFYKQTVTMDWRWHVLGLGYDSRVRQDVIERGAVLHYDGFMKPWLDIGIGKYKRYWSKYVNYDHPHLQRCNIHE